MIRKQDGEFVVECNDCGTRLYGGVIEDFREFVADIKENGWSVRKVEDEWEHYCEDCVS